MQVLPRVYSTESDGSDEKEFLMDFFNDVHDMLSKLFLKGYQWPFDVRKVADGSSIIDIWFTLKAARAAGFSGLPYKSCEWSIRL